MSKLSERHERELSELHARHERERKHQHDRHEAESKKAYAGKADEAGEVGTPGSTPVAAAEVNPNGASAASKFYPNTKKR